MDDGGWVVGVFLLFYAATSIRGHGNYKKSLFDRRQRKRDYTEKLHENKVE